MFLFSFKSPELEMLFRFKYLSVDSERNIKNNMPNKEMFLSAEEKKLLQKSYNHEKEGKLISSKDLKKKLGL